MVSCTVCKELSIICIPTMNEPVYLCARHITQIPADTLQTLFRDCIPDTFEGKRANLIAVGRHVINGYIGAGHAPPRTEVRGIRYPCTPRRTLNELEEKHKEEQKEEESEH